MELVWPACVAINKKHKVYIYIYIYIYIYVSYYTVIYSNTVNVNLILIYIELSEMWSFIVNMSKKFLVFEVIFYVFL